MSGQEQRSRSRRQIADQGPLVVCLAFLGLAVALGRPERTVNPYWIWICIAVAGISGTVWVYNLRWTRGLRVRPIYKTGAILALLAAGLVLFGRELVSEAQLEPPPLPPIAETPSSAELKPEHPAEAPPVAPESAPPEAEAPLREEQQPTAPDERSLVGAGGSITQKTTGDYSPAIVAGGDVMIGEERDPNEPITTYDFYGFKHIERPGNKFEVYPGENAALQEMVSLYKAQNWEALAKLCETEIRTVSIWLTPYCCAGAAYANLGKRERAIECFEYAEKHAYGNSKYAGATLLLEQLRGAETEGAGATGP